MDDGGFYGAEGAEGVCLFACRLLSLPLSLTFFFFGIPVCPIRLVDTLQGNDRVLLTSYIYSLSTIRSLMPVLRAHARVICCVRSRTSTVVTVVLFVI